MYLIGQSQIDVLPNDHSLIASMFDCLPVDLRWHVGETRFVGYESVSANGAGVRFFGMDVGCDTIIPDNLVAWNLAKSELGVYEPPSHRLVAAEGLRWRWLDEPSSGKRNTTGEFDVELGSSYWPKRRRSHRRFSVFANAYFDVGKDGLQDAVHIVDYEPQWDLQFKKMEAWLWETLGPETILRVEHYGSTAVPGMPAKPIVDILVEIPSFAFARPPTVSMLNGPFWECWWYSDHMVFVKRKYPMGEREYHIHMAPASHAVWRGIPFATTCCHILRTLPGTGISSLQWPKTSVTTAKSTPD
jgi:hypothetical protein